MNLTIKLTGIPIPGGTEVGRGIDETIVTITLNIVTYIEILLI
jgi:hypothetical protein